MVEKPDPLWDPDLPGDKALERLESMLGVYRHVPKPGLAWPNARPSVPGRRRRRISLAVAAALVACVAGVTAWMPWRLQWSESRPWAIEANVQLVPESLAVGQTL